MQRGSALRGVAVFLSRHTQAAQRFSSSFFFFGVLHAARLLPFLGIEKARLSRLAFAV
jgi:hypothetical protein